LEELRVLHVVTDRDRRGAQVFGMDLADGLGRMKVQNEVVALALGTHGDGLEIECLGPSRRSWRTMRELRSRAKSVDVVVAHGSATLLVASIALLASGVPFVYRQISDPLHWAATWPRRLRVGLYLRRPAAIVALSNLAATVLVQHYRLDRNRIIVIPNAVPDAKFTATQPAERAQVRERFGLRSDLPVAIYVGALAQEKGVDIAIRAAGKISELQLLVVGDGPERPGLEQLASQLGPDRIVFAGALDHPEHALGASDLLVLPSLGGDSMPAVLIEAGLSGLASVTTPVGSITDIVVDGVTGHVVPIDDQTAFDTAVQDLISDPTRRHEFGLAARQHCERHFTIASTAPAWRDLLNEVASRQIRRVR
jgi:glycosyltransferase involved in cell wall biosynthesis